MAMTFEKLSAYQGSGWKPRTRALDREVAAGSTWSAMRVSTEYQRLKAVLLYCPGAELSEIRNPNRVQHLERINVRKISAEFRNLASIYKNLGVDVFWIDRAAFGRNPSGLYNLMYARDLLFNTRAGAVIARMGSEIRAGEEKYAAHAVASLGIPIARTIGGTGLFEGADALWLDEKTVLCGIGNRTNREGFRQLREVLRLQGVSCFAVRLPSGIQHLLGILQLVDRDLALVRNRKLPRPLRSFLASRGVRLVEIDETDEVISKQGMNLVTLAPRTVIMAEGCPELRRVMRSAGIEVAAEVGIGELLKGAGGIACATAILAREMKRSSR